MDCGLGFVCVPKCIEKNYLMQFFAVVVSILLGIEKISVSILMLLVSLFDLILYVPSTVLQLNRDGSSWVEPVLS